MTDFGDHVEVEWQFDVDDLGAVERGLRHLPASLPIAVTKSEDAEHVDTYFEADDWRIYRSGYALRLRRARSGAELTLKAIRSSGQGYAKRREITQNLVDPETDSIDDIHGLVGDRVAALRGRKAIGPLFTAITRRKRYRMWHDGQEIGELSLDHTTFVGGAFEDQSQFMRVEIETTVDLADQVAPLTDAIARACLLRPATKSKFESGIAILGLQPPEMPTVGSVEFDRDSSITQVALAVLRRHFVELLRHEPGTRLGDDPEELHDMRVAARRLRAALSLFAPYLTAEFDSIRTELRWLASMLGDVRDLDVQLAEVRGWSDNLDALDAAALGPLLDELNRRRITARACMLSALDSERFELLTTDFAERLRTGIDADESDPATVAAPDLIMRRYRKFRRGVDRLKQSSTDSDYHEVRIQAKRLRYALEFVKPLYGKSTGKFIAQLVGVQDLLGLHQDSIVAIEHLREIAVDPSVSLPPATVFAMGRVAERYADAAKESRERFPKIYKTLAGNRLDRLKRELRKEARKQADGSRGNRIGNESDSRHKP